MRIFRCMVVRVLLFIFLAAVESHSEETDTRTWSAADMLPRDTALSVFRYGAFGLGAYPYRFATPGAGLMVRIDGVPLRSLSPFGPDLELVPAGIVGGVECRDCRKIWIRTREDDGREAVTDTGFYMGGHRRFTYETSFRRNMGKTGKIFFNGMSSGIHGGGDTPKNSFRHYFMKYRRLTEKRGAAEFMVYAFRDRDGLLDLDGGVPMGERKTDAVTAALSLRDYPLGKRTTVSPVFYCRSLNSRFHRYGLRKSLDDDAAGMNVVMTTTRGASEYRVLASYDMCRFNSRIHRSRWTRHETELSVSFRRERDGRTVRLNGGFLYSSEYGSGVEAGGSVTLPLTSSAGLVVRGCFSDEFPDTGMEYYPSLVFSDTTLVSDLRRYTVAEGEFGVKFSGSRVNFGVFGYASSSETPSFRPTSNVYDPHEGSPPAPTRVCIAGGKRASGCRFFVDSHVEGGFRLDFSMRGKMRFTGAGSREKKTFWPYPSCELLAESRVSGDFFGGGMKASLFGDAAYRKWEDAGTSPSGGYGFFDCGVSVRVDTLELFYVVENVSNEEMTWFGTYGWLGRNGMWGVRWRFID